MGSRCSEREGRSSREPSREMLQEILLKLPTRDVARFGCVSRLRRSIVTDRSFGNLHGATYVAPSADAQLLLVSHKRLPSWTDEASIFNVSSGKPMCHVTIPRKYSLANICNGFLCFVHGHQPEAPAVACNPVTGEKLTLPRCPPMPAGYDDAPHIFAMGFSPSTGEYIFAMGFSPSTGQYKLFRFSFRPNYHYHDSVVHMHVYTLGGRGGGGWRHHSLYLSESRPAINNPPLLIYGKLYIVCIGSAQREGRRVADKMLVLDVATETRRMYRIPYPINRHNWCRDPMVDSFEMNGQLCLAVTILREPPGHQIQFWVMSPPPDDQKLDDDDDKLYWDLRYSFDVADGPNYLSQMTAAWLDDGGMLCYRHGDTLYKHDTRIHSDSVSPSHLVDGLPWDQKLRLPPTAHPSLKQQKDTRSYKPFWNVYSGYRPTLLSPLALSSPPPQDAYDQGHKLEEDVLGVVRGHQ